MLLKARAKIFNRLNTNYSVDTHPTINTNIILRQQKCFCNDNKLTTNHIADNVPVTEHILFSDYRNTKSVSWHDVEDSNFS